MDGALMDGALDGIDSADGLAAALREVGYFADHGLATSIYLALALRRPLLLEGEAGVGKTEVARAVAQLTGGRLIRLQCYEGLDVHHAVYEWDYARQLLHIRLMEAAGGADGGGGDRERLDRGVDRQRFDRQRFDRQGLERELYSEEFLLKRPLLQALEAPAEGEGPPPVLLIDELDRADEELEAFLLELLSDFQVTVPELGTFAAERPPVVVITSNRTRELHDALRRRCLYRWVEYPSAEKELAIVRGRLPAVEEELARQLVALTQRLREEDFYKRPGVAETLDWAAALTALGQRRLETAVVRDTLGLLLKYQDDIEALAGDKLEELVAAAVG